MSKYRIELPGNPSRRGRRIAAMGLGSALIATAGVSLFGGPTTVVAAPAVTCEAILSKSNELARKGSDKKTDAVFIGKKLETDPRWVERCLVSYGRDVTRSPPRGSEPLEDVFEKWERNEREEAAREEDQGYVKPAKTDIPRNRSRRTPKAINPEN